MMDAAAKAFFSSPRFAVAGASSDPTKFGHKIFLWYLAHSLPVTPLNPNAPSITVSSSKTTQYSTLKSPSALSAPADTSLSVITPPRVTRSILEEASTAGLRRVWMQPGSFDDEVLRFAREKFETVVAGTEGGSLGEDGWCVLVDGEGAMRKAGKL